ncbi:peptidoglycan DD-metalloendopeptidase family protein [bacterium]|nr:peptidoglycan DD-metalloendopeptidase family protein [bacterium]
MSGIEGFYHTVRSGETLSGIAYKHSVGERELATLNNIRDVNRIKVGQKIFVPYQGRRTTSSGSTKPIGSGGAALVRASGKLAWPVRGRVTRNYGSTSRGMPCHGMVIAVAAGTAVKAADSGKVAISYDYMRGYGRTVVIDHGNGMTTVYANNGQLLVRQGENVKKGQTIARSGSTGRASGGQVEFRVYRNGAPQDPRRYLGG